MTVLKMLLLPLFTVRASNGVIIITTKKGRKTLAVDYNFQYGSGELVKTVDVFDAAAFRALLQKNALQMYQN
jgi:iron complex outermembrane receptor protein